MALYWTDFSEYTTGQEPDGYSEQFGEPSSLTIAEVAEAIGGKVLNFSTNQSSSSVHARIIEDVSADPDNDNIEFLAKFRYNNDQGSFILGARQINPFATRSVYWHGNYVRGSDHSELAKHVNGSYSTMALDFSGIDFVVGTWYWVRIRINGTDHLYKEWEDGDPEPETWILTDVDSDVAGTGNVLLNGWGNDEDWDLDVLSIATNGETAPFDDPSGGGTTYNESFSLGQTNELSPPMGNIIVDDAIEIGQQSGILEDSTLEGIASFVLSNQSIISLASQLLAEDAVQINQVSSVTVNGGLTVEDSFTLALQNAMSFEATEAVVVSFSLGSQSLVTTEGQLDAQDSIDLTQASGLTLLDQLDASGMFVLNMQVAIGLLANAVVEAGLSISSLSEITVTGQSITSNVTLPDGRTLKIKLENRTLTIEKDSRTLTIEKDNRTLDIS